MQDDQKGRGSVTAKLLFIAAFAAFVTALLWGSDRITMQGERTIYTVDCAQGTWTGNTCSGTLVPGKRYAFRASKARNEVAFWIRGSTVPSGKYSDCQVTDRDNWTCNVTLSPAPATIAYEMVKGHATRAGAGLTLPFHSVPKWKWWLLDVGFGRFTEAGE